MCRGLGRGSWKDFQITSAMAYGCIPNDVEQPESCCRDFMTPVVEHPCAGHVFASDATINTLGSMVARRCGLDPPRTPEPRCALLPGPWRLSPAYLSISSWSRDAVCSTSDARGWIVRLQTCGRWHGARTPTRTRRLLLGGEDCCR